MNTMNEVQERLDAQRDRCLSCRHLGPPDAGGIRCRNNGPSDARGVTAWCLQFVAFHQESYLYDSASPYNTCRFYSEHTCGQYERATS